MTLDAAGASNPKPAVTATVPTEPKSPDKQFTAINQEPIPDPAYTPTLNEPEHAAAASPVVIFNNQRPVHTIVEKKETRQKLELAPEVQEPPVQPVVHHVAEPRSMPVQQPAATAVPPAAEQKNMIQFEKSGPAAAPAHAAPAPKKAVEPASVPDEPAQAKEDAAFDMQLVIKQEVKPAPEHIKEQAALPEQGGPAEGPVIDEMEEQKRRASERIQKLRNLSFNINGTESNTEFESVPAYIRRNLELYNTVSSAENFYSNYSVKSDTNNKSQISTINTFLDGKKPD